MRGKIIAKIVKRGALVAVGLFCLISLQGQAVYSTNGTYAYTVPAGVTQVKVECWGAGGGGSSSIGGVGGGGGGGGAYASGFVSVVPGNAYLLTVGAGGVANTNGGNSFFNTNSVLAAGGSGGIDNSNTAGAGGSVAASIGTIKYAGGNGANGYTWWYGGAGGGGAGSLGNGGNANATTPGTGTSQYGGDGATRQGTYNANGLSGNVSGGGGSGAYGGWSVYRTGGTGADGRVIISLPANVALSSPNQVIAADVYQGTNKHPISSFEMAVSNYSPILNSVSFPTTGTYTATDISRFQLWYSAINDITTASQIGSDITTGLGVGTHSFTGLSQLIGSGSTAYFWITADIELAAAGATISAGSLVPEDIVFDFASVTGSVNSGGAQTFQLSPAILLSSSNPAVPAANIDQGTNDNVIYSFSTAVTTADATLNSATFTTTGNYGEFDLTRFKLWYNTSNDFSTATRAGSDLISSLGTGTHVFSAINLTCNAGSTIYFWITANVSSFPNARNLTVSAITTNDLVYTIGLKSGTAYNGGQQTIRLLNGVLITTNYPAVSANSLPQGTSNQRIYKFTSIITGANRRITSLTFETVGTYVASDVTNFKLWYNTVNSLVSATQISSITTSLGVGTHTFGGLNQTTNRDNTGYFWITVDISPTAVAANTLQVNALTSGNVTYNSGTKYVSTFYGGVQTILQNIDTDGDGTSDLYDFDDDNDGIPDFKENIPCNSSVAELFPNSGFEAGNVGFSSGYGYATGHNSLYPEGVYTVTSNAYSVHDHFANCTGHGNMMVINGSPNADMVVWSSGSITVTPYTDYTLSVEIASVTTENPSQLIFNVNGENIGSQFNATSSTCNWVSAQAIWNSGSMTSATFEIVNLNLIAGGNDFAIDNVSCTYRLNCDSDGDILPDILDLDSDNDGIYDVVEAGGVDAGNGTISGFSDGDGDGLSDNVDNVNSGAGAGEVTSGTALANSDTDGDGSPNAIDLDSDGDLCMDVVEAWFTDADGDGLLGSSPVSINSNGKVTSATGYLTPGDADGNSVYDFIQAVPVITTQPVNAGVCIASTTVTSFSVTATNVGGTYQWQESTDGGTTWSDIAGATSATLNLTGIDATYDHNLYRVLLSHVAYVCSPLISDEVELRAFTSIPAQPGPITGNTTVCQNVGGLEYSINAVPQAESYTWAVPIGWFINSGSGTDTILANSGNNGGNITVSAVNLCGTSTPQTLAVTVEDPTPTFIAPTATSVCQSVDITYTTQAGKSDYIWNITTGSVGADYTITSGGTTVDNSITVKWLTPGARTVTVNYSNGGCAGTPASKTITVVANAIVLTQPVTPSAMCAGTGSEILSITTFGAVSGYQWQISTDGGTTWADLSNISPYSNVTTNSMTITNPSGTLDNAQYRCLITGSCGDITSNSITLTVNSTEITSQSTDAQAQCIGGAFSPISVVGFGETLSYQWYSNTTATTSGGTDLGAGNGAQTDTYTPQVGAAGTLYYYCVVTGKCASATSAVSGAFVVNPLPVITISASPATICFGDYSSLSASGGVSYVWTSNPVSSLTDLDDATIANPTYTPSSNPTTIPPIITTTFTVEVTDANTCVNTKTVDVILYRTPETGPQYHINNTWGN